DAKIDPMQSGAASLIYSTIIGGNGHDLLGGGISVNNAGEAYISGWTQSSNFPLQASLHNFKGSSDTVALKLNSSGTHLLYSTLLGGTADEQALASAFVNGSFYVVGVTTSNDFPLKNPLPG